jgi:hypothetical protein
VVAQKSAGGHGGVTKTCPVPGGVGDRRTVSGSWHLPCFMKSLHLDPTGQKHTTHNMAKYKLEYIWLDGYEPTANLRSKTQIKDFEAFPKLEQLPMWCL